MNNMIELDITIVFQLVNFLITLVVLNYILIRPVRNQISARQSLMAAEAGEIENFTQKASSKLTQYEASLKDARSSANTARENIKAEGHSKEQDIIRKSQADAQTFLQSSREQIATEAMAAKNALMSEVQTFAAKAAAKILG